MWRNLFAPHPPLLKWELRGEWINTPGLRSPPDLPVTCFCVGSVRCAVRAAHIPRSPFSPVPCSPWSRPIASAVQFEGNSSACVCRLCLCFCVYWRVYVDRVSSRTKGAVQTPAPLTRYFAFPTFPKECVGFWEFGWCWRILRYELLRGCRIRSERGRGWRRGLNTLQESG